MNSPPIRYTLANSQSPYVVKVGQRNSTMNIKRIRSFQWNRVVALNNFACAFLFNLLKSTEESYSNERHQTTSETISYASYDNIMNYCLNSKKENDSNYAIIDYNAKAKNFEKRCANYDNLSHLTKKISRRSKVCSRENSSIDIKEFVLDQNRRM